MKKSIMNIGIVTVTLIAFWTIALSIDGVMELIYENTSIVDDLMYSEIYSIAIFSIATITTVKIHSEILKRCNG